MKLYQNVIYKKINFEADQVISDTPVKGVMDPKLIEKQVLVDL